MNNYLQTIQQFLLLSPYALLIINQIPLFQTIDSPLTYTLAAASIFTRLIFFLLHAFTFNLPPKILINSQLSTGILTYISTVLISQFQNERFLSGLELMFIIIANIIKTLEFSTQKVMIVSIVLFALSFSSIFVLIFQPYYLTLSSIFIIVSAIFFFYKILSLMVRYQDIINQIQKNIGISILQIDSNQIFNKFYSQIEQILYTSQLIELQNQFFRVVQVQSDDLINQMAFSSIFDSKKRPSWGQTLIGQTKTNLVEEIQTDRRYSVSIERKILKDLVQNYFSRLEECQQILILDDNNNCYSLRFSKIKYGNIDNFFLILQMNESYYLQQELIRLKCQNEELKNGINHIAHEIRTPLSAILNFQETLKSQLNENIVAKFIEPCIFSAKILFNIVNNVLDSSQLEEGKLKIIKEQFNIYKFLNKTIQLFQIQASRKSLKINYNVGDGVPKKITTDSDRLRQIIINLIGNALKFTKKGSINVDADKFVSQNGIQTVRISVNDTGVGIDPHNIPKLFSQFSKDIEQKHQSLNKLGVGLGLAISQKLAKLLGPEGNNGISISSEIGKGTSFTFIVEAGTCLFGSGDSDMDSIIIDLKPKKIEEIQKKIQQSHQNFSMTSFSHKKSMNSMSKLRSIWSLDSGGELSQIPPPVLVVDDDPFNGLAVQQLLKLWNIPADVAINGQEALELVKQKQEQNSQYKLIFLDYSLDDMNGIELLVIMKRIMGQNQGYFVALSGHQDEKTQKEFERMGANQYALKPLTKPGLKKILNTLAQKS